ncbi:amidase [Rhodophyticola sp. SM2404]
MSDLLDLDALELSGAIAAREVSPVEVMRESLARIDALNPALNAIVSLRDREALMGEARLAEAMPPQGWLHGIPIAVKDLVAVKGLRSTSGSPLLADFIPAADDGIVRALKAAGAIVIGKTNVPAYGLGSHSTNTVFGATRGPYEPSRTAGGSSGGAGAALAARMVCVADGSDMMGSLRNPAAWNNVYGFRPSVGLVAGEAGDSVVQHKLSTLGPMARSVSDLEALLATMSEGRFVPAEQAARGAQLRIGWLGDWGGAYAMEEGILAQSNAALAQMEALGWHVEPVAPPVSAAMLWESWTQLRSFAVAMSLGAHWRDEGEKAQLNAQAQWEISHGFALTGEQLERAAQMRLDWLACFRDLMTRFDALVLPSTQIWPFPVEWAWPEEIGGVTMDSYHRWMEVVVPASLIGAPVLNLPAGFGKNGLPAGVQLIGRHGADAQVLAMGRAYHAATQWPQNHPPVLAT